MAKKCERRRAISVLAAARYSNRESADKQIILTIIHAEKRFVALETFRRT